MRRTKTLKFNISDPREKELFDYLQTLPHGKFSEQTKLSWMAKMEIDEVSKRGFPRKDGDKV